MPQPFSAVVTSADWRADAEAWVADRIAERGWSLVGEFVQPRVRPWSTQLTVETTAGRVWFKANAPAFGFEPALQRELAAIAPWGVQEPLAVDVGRQWMLTADHPPPLGESADPTAEEWTALLVEAARLQRATLAHRDRLLATGLPDRAPATVPALFDALRAQLRAYPPEHPGHLSPEGDRRLEAVRSSIVAAARRLDACAYPDAWNHGDLHPHNVYREGDRLRLFDFGDGSWANALEILAVPAEWLAYRRDDAEAIDWVAVLDAFATEWGVDAAIAPRWDDVRIVHAVNRSKVWAAWLDETTPDELERYGREPSEHLLSVLDVLDAREGHEAV